MSTDTEHDKATHEAIGWLVHSAGREFMLHQAERATAEHPDIAAVLDGWAMRLTSPGDRPNLIRRAADALENAAGWGVWEKGEAERWAEVALLGAGFIREREVEG